MSYSFLARAAAFANFTRATAAEGLRRISFSAAHGESFSAPVSRSIALSASGAGMDIPAASLMHLICVNTGLKSPSSSPVAALKSSLSISAAAYPRPPSLSFSAASATDSQKAILPALEYELPGLGGVTRARESAEDYVGWAEALGGFPDAVRGFFAPDTRDERFALRAVGEGEFAFASEPAFHGISEKFENGVGFAGCGKHYKGPFHVSRK